MDEDPAEKELSLSQISRLLAWIDFAIFVQNKYLHGWAL